MNELDKRLDKIEQQLSVISGNQSSVFGNPISSRSDEIDLRELFAILWQGKWWVIAITFLFAVAGVFYALSLPNMYKSEGVYAPAQKEGAGGGMAGQLGGLASLAGVSLGGGESNDIDQAMALITSWPFLEGVINKNDLKPLIMGVKGWNRESGELIWDKDIYNPVNKNWLRKPQRDKEAEPSSFETFRQLTTMLSVKNDAKVGMLTITVEHYSPRVAKSWVELLAYEINSHFRERDKNEAQKNIEYLKKKIEETSISEMHEVFYGMIESQLQTLMLAEVGGEYLLNNVVIAKEAELKSSPKRAFIVLIAVLSGGLMSVLFVLYRAFVRGPV